MYAVTNKLIGEHNILVDEFNNTNTSSKNLISRTHISFPYAFIIMIHFTYEKNAILLFS